MKTELFTVSKVFTETIYRIPDYQRGYSWGIDQLNDFWIDIEQLQSDSKHYLGVLTLEEVPESKWFQWDDDTWIIKSRNFKPYYVVDGQQRLTTIILLITAIIEIIERRKTKYLNFSEIKDIRKKYIFDSKPEEISRSYIFGYEKDNPSYEYLKTHIFLEISNIHSPDEETIYTKNLLNAKNFFVEKINEMADEEINTVFTKITQRFVFNAYEISSDIDVFVTFETMNNRGKALTTLELLKNRLIFLSTKLPTSDYNENKLRQTINDAWKDAYHYLGKNSKRLIADDKFLGTFLAYFYFTNIEKISNDDSENEKKIQRFEMVMKRINRYLLAELFAQNRIGIKAQKDTPLPEITEKFIYDFSMQLKQSVELYYRLSSPMDSKYSDREKIILEQLGRLLDYGPDMLVFFIYQLESEKNTREDLIEIREKYYFIHFIAGNTRFFKRISRQDLTMRYISKKN
ncbi:DUF262 domain-containing protein [Treponema endosymbiont of Eucomonympha sp.]|uniref:DUF262 domain-containing protein n=1 Tax=Treponema endosymbiont of Eucomonympha sp. TaxID=1580831 RepID=UPI000AF44BDE|nr:DUF262 domain-containing protein [Treponema endosymbiont of Eucomonympha sp.]